MDRPVVLAHDPARYPKSHASPLLAFGGEERCEESFAMLDSNAFAIVGDHHPNSKSRRVCPIARVTDVQHDFSALPNSFQRVSDQVGEHLAHLSRKAADLAFRLVLPHDGQVVTTTFA